MNPKVLGPKWEEFCTEFTDYWCENYVEQVVEKLLDLKEEEEWEQEEE